MCSCLRGNQSPKTVQGYPHFPEYDVYTCTARHGTVDHRILESHPSPVMGRGEIHAKRQVYHSALFAKVGKLWDDFRNMCFSVTNVQVLKHRTQCQCKFATVALPFLKGLGLGRLELLRVEIKP